ncbi:MAG: hypothetical protein LC791_16675, partial [Acidobacteria bacterium]|nr:hypothetical protein [Acidobacteriota bacterium]
MDSLFVPFLAQFDDAAWLRTIDRIAHAMHPVDRAPTRVWFHLYPLALDRLMTKATDPHAVAQRLLLKGRWCLAQQIDSSHTFLYGHRFWPDVRQAVIEYATRGSAPSSLDLGAQIKELAGEVSRRLGRETELLVGIVAIGLRTLQQVGLERMIGAPGTIRMPPSWRRRTPEQV